MKHAVAGAGVEFMRKSSYIVAHIGIGHLYTLGIAGEFSIREIRIYFTVILRRSRRIYLSIGSL